MGPTQGRLVEAVCVVVAEQLLASNGTRPGLPNYEIPSVSAVAPHWGGRVVHSTVFLTVSPVLKEYLGANMH